MNAMLDGYPEEFEGYLIRTDFRIGMQICQCLADEDLSDYEKISNALYLLYGKGVPDVEVAMRGLSWFLNRGEIKDKSEDNEGEEESFDFEVDSELIMSGFLKVYHIDLERESMHWFKFLSMIGDLGECALTNVINIRNKKITADMPADQRETYTKLKKKYSLKEYTYEEQEKIKPYKTSEKTLTNTITDRQEIRHYGWE